MDSFFNRGDRRSHERFETRAMVQYFIKDSSTRFMDCELFDISRGGIAIYIPATEQVGPGMDVLLEINLPGSLEQITARGTVQRVQSDEKILVGVKFDGLLDPEVLARLIAC